jgi:ferrous iron transport protein B
VVRTFWQDKLFLAAVLAGLLFWLILYFIEQPAIRWGWPLTEPWQFLLPVLLFPILEEIVFRGLIQELVHEYISSRMLGPISLANLLTSLLFRDRPLLAGLAFVGCYLLGGLAALVSALLARRTLLEGRSRAMVLELPSYKRPALRTAFFTAYQQGMSFVQKAGTVIVAICIVMWWLSAYPKAEPPVEAVALRTQATAVQAVDPVRGSALMAEADGLEARYSQAHSFAGRLGRLVQPIYAPLGYDWQLTVGVLTSFLAREVFVSTMAVLILGKETEDLADEGVIARVREAVRDDGTPLFTPATAASLLVFFALAMQCLPTLVVTRRETGSWRWAALQLFWMTGLAWVAAFVTYQGLNLAGIS